VGWVQFLVLNVKMMFPGALSWITELAYVEIVEFRFEWDTFYYLDEIYLG
jgi:hypothetical protein